MESIFTYCPPEPDAPAAGPLNGLRVAVQPNLSAAGWPAEAGSHALTGFKALEDSTVARRLRGAGAALCGATRMSEFGFGLHGSRAGAALQQQAADAELVLDLMGESRLAAARAGVCGFKPSYGLVSRFGLIGLIPSMEACGILSRSPATIRDLLRAMAGRDELDFSLPDEPLPDFAPQPMDPKATTLGIIREAPAGPEAEFRASLEDLKKAGFVLREFSLPEFPLFSLVHRIVGSVEASSCAGRYDSVRYGPRAPGARNWNDMYLLSRGAAFGPLLKSYLFQGAFFQFERCEAYENACRIRARLVKDMQRLLADADVLVLPLDASRADDAPAPLADTYAAFASTLFANVTGQPALVLPKTGVQLAGPRRGDARLLALGGYLMENHGS